MKRILALAFAGVVAAVVAGCGGGGGGSPTTTPPPPPPSQYGGVAFEVGGNCAYIVGAITTRQQSRAAAERTADQRCETAARIQAAGASRPGCRATSFSQCAAFAVGTNDARQCGGYVRHASSRNSAISDAIDACESDLASGADCAILVNACSSSTAPSVGVWDPFPDSPPPPPPPPNGNTLPPEPPRTTAPQAPGSDRSGVEVAGAGGTTYVSALNRTSGTVTYQASTWFEPKDGKYQRMIVTQSTSVPPGQVVRIPTACMQRGNPAPSSGARFFSNPKRASGSVQQCQTSCLSSGQSIQSCVWNCERSTPPPSTPEIVFQTNDNCDDGHDVNMRFSYYRGTNHFVNWATGVLAARGSDTVTRVSCNFSNVNRVCYGARIQGGNTYWGHDVDRSESCTNCCWTCTPSIGSRRETLNFGCPRQQ